MGNTDNNHELTLQVICSNLSVSGNYYCYCFVISLHREHSNPTQVFQNKIILLSERSSTTQEGLESHKMFTISCCPCLAEDKSFQDILAVPQQALWPRGRVWALLCTTCVSLAGYQTSPSLVSSSISQR